MVTPPVNSRLGFINPELILDLIIDPRIIRKKNDPVIFIRLTIDIQRLT